VCENVKFEDGAAFLNGVYCNGSSGDAGDGYTLTTPILPRMNEGSFHFMLSFKPNSDSGWIIVGGQHYRWFGLQHISYDGQPGKLYASLNNQRNGFCFNHLGTVVRGKWHHVEVAVDIAAGRVQVQRVMWDERSEAQRSTITESGQTERDILVQDWTLPPGTTLNAPADGTDKAFTFTNFSNGGTFHGHVKNLLLHPTPRFKEPTGPPRQLSLEVDGDDIRWGTHPSMGRQARQFMRDAAITASLLDEEYEADLTAALEEPTPHARLARQRSNMSDFLAELEEEPATVTQRQMAEAAERKRKEDQSRSRSRLKSDVHVPVTNGARVEYISGGYGSGESRMSAGETGVVVRGPDSDGDCKVRKDSDGEITSYIHKSRLKGIPDPSSLARQRSDMSDFLAEMDNDLERVRSGLSSDGGDPDSPIGRSPRNFAGYKLQKKKSALTALITEAEDEIGEEVQPSPGSPAQRIKLHRMNTMEREKRNTEADASCPLCLSCVWSPVVTPGCAHTFCLECITGWLDHCEQMGKPKKCPMCRANLGRWKPTVVDVDQAKEEQAINVFGRTPSMEERERARKEQVEEVKRAIEMKRRVKEEGEQLLASGDGIMIRCGFRMYGADNHGSYQNYELYVEGIGPRGKKVPVHLFLEKARVEQEYRRQWWGHVHEGSHFNTLMAPDFTLLATKADVTAVKFHLRFKSSVNIPPTCVFLPDFSDAGVESGFESTYMQLPAWGDIKDKTLRVQIGKLRKDLQAFAKPQTQVSAEEERKAKRAAAVEAHQKLMAERTAKAAAAAKKKTKPRT